MPAMTKPPHGKPAERLQMGQRIHPELRRSLKAAAALEGISMEALLHGILCRELNRPDLLPDAAATQA